MKLLTLILVLVIGYLGYDTYYGRNGYVQYQAVEAKVQDAREKSDKLSMRNQAVADEIEDLQQDNLTVEELARDELGMIKPGETFYRVIDTNQKTPSKNGR